MILLNSEIPFCLILRVKELCKVSYMLSIFLVVMVFMVVMHNGLVGLEGHA